MTLYDYYCEPEPDTRILFKDFILNNSADIKTYMLWENYDLNETVLPVVELLKDHALVQLQNSYGKFKVEEEDILEPFFADIFTYFPVLMQQLAITRLIDANGVVKNDTDIVETVRTETLAGTVEQNSELTQGTSSSTTGTVMVESDIDQTQTNITHIENDSGVLATGTKNVNLTHNIPEQAVDGSTGNFPTDAQGTPILTDSYVQQAAESFTTSNPITTSETSDQNATNTTNGTNSALTTNDITVANTGSDNSNSITTTDNTNSTTETITSTLTNKQYSYEIKAFLETADSIIAFKKWEDSFSWVVGIV